MKMNTLHWCCLGLILGWNDILLSVFVDRVQLLCYRGGPRTMSQLKWADWESPTTSVILSPSPSIKFFNI